MTRTTASFVREDLEDLYFSTNQDPEPYVFGPVYTDREPLVVYSVLFSQNIWTLHFVRLFLCAAQTATVTQWGLYIQIYSSPRNSKENYSTSSLQVCWSVSCNILERGL